MVGLLLVASLVHLLYLAVTKSKSLQISLLLRTPWDGWSFQHGSIGKQIHQTDADMMILNILEYNILEYFPTRWIHHALIMMGMGFKAGSWRTFAVWKKEFWRILMISLYMKYQGEPPVGWTSRCRTHPESAESQFSGRWKMVPEKIQLLRYSIDRILFNNRMVDCYELWSLWLHIYIYTYTHIHL